MGSGNSFILPGKKCWISCERISKAERTWISRSFIDWLQRWPGAIIGSILYQHWCGAHHCHIRAASWINLLVAGSTFETIKKRKKTKWLSPVLIITGLWLFSLLAGAQPSILRSALMFTCIVWGETFSRKTSIFNTMAVSAFILLCINPYFLWDVGFQLSYAAVLSIIIFMRPIYNWFYIKIKC